MPYILPFRSTTPLQAGTKEKLIELIREEEIFWTGKFSGGLILNRSEGRRFDLKYSGVEAYVIEVGENPSDWPRGIGAPLGQNFLLPSRDSEHGRAIVKELDQGDFEIASALGIAFSIREEMTPRTESLLSNGIISRNSAITLSQGEILLRVFDLKDEILRDLLPAPENSEWNERIRNAISSSEASADSIKKSNEHAKDAADKNISLMDNRRRKINHVASILIDRAIRRHNSIEKDWQDKFQNISDTYTKQMHLRPMVEIWGMEESENKRLAEFYSKLFYSASASVAILSVLMAYNFGGRIGDLFRFNMCPPFISGCTYNHPATGIFFMGVLLLSASIMLWMLRLTHKLFISHRHLAIAARERSAFARAYLAMVHDGTIGKEQDAIVLAALFRPTQEGVLKDDDGGAMDISAASILAKALASK